MDITQDLDVLDIKDEERQPCEIWTRVMGYHRPVSSFNRGKKGEFAERQYFLKRNVTDVPVGGLVPLSTCDWPGELAATNLLPGLSLALSLLSQSAFAIPCR